MSDSDDQPALLWTWNENLCPVPAGPARRPVPVRKPRRVPTLLPHEEEELRAAWTRGMSAGRWRSLATLRGRLRAKALRKLVRSIVVARQTDLFEARQAIEDLLGLLADTAERNRD